MRVRYLGRKTGTVLLAVLIATISMTGCGNSKTVEKVPELVEPVGVDIDTVKVKKMNLSSVSSYQGEIIPEIKGLYFVNSGNIDKLLVSEGDRVKKGQLLATLTSADSGVKKMQKQLKEKIAENKDANNISQYDIDRLKEELSQLEKQKKTAKGKKEKKGIKMQILEKEQDIILAKARLGQQKESQALEIKHLKEDIETARTQTKESKLYSPVNGEIISTTGGSGYMVQGGVTAINVADMDKPRIRTSYIGGSILGKASSYMATVNGKQYKVKVEEQNVSAYDIEMGNYPSNTWFDFEEKVALKVGDSATIELYNDTAENALVVPSNAVFKSKGESYVYRMEGNAKKRTAITVGTITDAYTQILTGVKEGDVVYVQD